LRGREKLLSLLSLKTPVLQQEAKAFYWRS